VLLLNYNFNQTQSGKISDVYWNNVSFYIDDQTLHNQVLFKIQIFFVWDINRYEFLFLCQLLVVHGSGIAELVVHPLTDPKVSVLNSNLALTKSVIQILTRINVFKVCMHVVTTTKMDR
jgi:hypothetical protein